MASTQNVLILTSDTGGGHRSAAKALESSFNRLSDNTCEFMVSISRVLENASSLTKGLGDIYNFLLRHNQDWVKYYYWAVNHMKLNESKLLIEAARGYSSKVVKQACPNVVVSVHPMTQHLFAYVLKKLKLIGKIPLVTVVTDPCYGFWQGWACQDVEKYYVASEGAEQQLVEYGIEQSRIEVMGMPIDPIFHPVNDLEKLSLRKAMGIYPEKFTIFVNAGWVGGGHIPQIFKELCQYHHPNVQLIFLAGKNKKLERHAQELARHAKVPVRVLGYSSNIHQLMKMSDVMVSKLGGLTTFEALSCGLPIIADVVNEPMPQEAETGSFLKDSGAGILLDNPRNIVYVVESLNNSPDAYHTLRQAAQQHQHHGVSDKIAQDIAQSFC